MLGGARSGKSRFAEQLVTASPPPWVYIATAQIFDAEMRERVREHRTRRSADWTTVEAPIDLSEALAAVAGRPVLVDCLTLWLTNLMLGGHDVSEATDALQRALMARRDLTVLVSNEVGLGIVPETKLGRDFRDAAGLLNQRIAGLAANVSFMVAGLPMKVK